MNTVKKIRLDELLVEQGYFQNADEALRAVIAGQVLVDDIVATSAASKITPDSQVRIRGQKRYVSRGGHKLKGAIDAFSVSVSGLNCLDIGSSTGGFSDCLLQEGAKSVTCVDVNYGQLDWKLRSDSRVRVFERTNIKKISCEELGGPFDAIVIDVSFIGLASLTSHIARFSKKETILLALVKPQFESKAGETEGGVVHDEEVRLRCVSEVEDSLGENGFAVKGFVESPIKGPAGNVEYVVYAIFDR